MRSREVIAIINTVFVVIYFIVGLSAVIYGADSGSRFFYVDNIFIHVSGCMLIILSIGLLIRKELSRKGIIILCILLLIEFMTTYIPHDESISKIIQALIYQFIVYGLGIIFFILPKVKMYFAHNIDSYRNNAGLDYNYKKIVALLIAITISSYVIIFILCSTIGYKTLVNSNYAILAVGIILSLVLIIYLVRWCLALNQRWFAILPKILLVLLGLFVLLGQVLTGVKNFKDYTFVIFALLLSLLLIVLPIRLIYKKNAEKERNSKLNLY